MLDHWIEVIVDMDSHEIQLPEHHQEILDCFIAACYADERIIAAFLGGSYANGSADEFSDLDLFFITTDEVMKNSLPSVRPLSAGWVSRFF